MICIIERKMSVGELIKRYAFFVAGLFVMAFGVSFSIKANLGTSPISSFPYVTSLISPLSVGQATIAMHVVFIILQIIILRRKYEPIQLMQLPVAVVFGYLTDFALWIVDGLGYSNYLQQWLLCIIGIVLVAVGVSMEVAAGVVMLAGEGVVLAVCRVAPIKFGNMKIVFDVSLVVISIAVSWSMLGTVEGVREGTVAAALFVGFITKQLNRHTRRLMNYIVARR